MIALHVQDDEASMDHAVAGVASFAMIRTTVHLRLTSPNFPSKGMRAISSARRRKFRSHAARVSAVGTARRSSDWAGFAFVSRLAYCFQPVRSTEVRIRAKILSILEHSPSGHCAATSPTGGLPLPAYLSRCFEETVRAKNVRNIFHVAARDSPVSFSQLRAGVLPPTQSAFRAWHVELEVREKNRQHLRWIRLDLYFRAAFCFSKESHAGIHAEFFERAPTLYSHYSI